MPNPPNPWPRLRAAETELAELQTKLADTERWRQDQFRETTRAKERMALVSAIAHAQEKLIIALDQRRLFHPNTATIEIARVALRSAYDRLAAFDLAYDRLAAFDFACKHAPKPVGNIQGLEKRPPLNAGQYAAKNDPYREGE